MGGKIQLQTANPVPGLEVHIVTPRGPCGPRARSPVWIFCCNAFNVLERELALKLGLKRGQGTDQLCARLLESSSRCDCPVRLDFHKEIWVQWVRDLVAGEKDLWHGMELAEKILPHKWVSDGKVNVNEAHPRIMLASVWSCLTIFIVAALGIFVSSVTSTLYK